MKKLILLLFVPLFWGCEKYELPTHPKISGQWIVDGVEFPITNSQQSYILKDTVIISDRELSRVTSNGVGVFTYDWKNPNIPWHDKFIIGKTVWEFETNIVGIPDRNNSGSPFYKEWDYYEIYSDGYSPVTKIDYWSQMEIKSFRKRNYTIVQYGLNVIKIKVPRVWTMYRYNGQTYFLKEDIVLTLVRI